MPLQLLVAEEVLEESVAHVMIKHRASGWILHDEFDALTLRAERLRNREIKLLATKVETERVIHVGEVEGNEDGGLSFEAQGTSDLPVVRPFGTFGVF
jgi:hypothetical protein